MHVRTAMGEQTVGEIVGQRIRVHDAALTDVQVVHGPVRNPGPHMSYKSSEPLVNKVLNISGFFFASASTSAGDNRTLLEVLVVAWHAQALALRTQGFSIAKQAHAKHLRATDWEWLELT